MDVSVAVRVVRCFVSVLKRYIINVLEFSVPKPRVFARFSWILNRGLAKCYVSRRQIKDGKLSPGLLGIIHFVRIKPMFFT